jgi:hypothetical protein
MTSRSTDDLPRNLRDALRVALDDDAAKVARLRAVQTLEHTKEPFRRDVAAALVPVLSHAADIAGRVHVALLVLAPDLRLLRDPDAADAGFVVVDRGFALDELPKLFSPGEDLPQFLTPPEKPAPQPYRDPQVVREEELQAFAARRRAAHEALLSKMQELGLDADDLDDDVADDADRAAGKARRFVPLKGGTPWASFSFVDDRDAVIDNGVDVVRLGRLRPGAWWSEATAGDHKGARRFRIGVAVDMAPPFTTRRERALEVGRAGVTITAGHADLDVDVTSRGVVIFVDTAPVVAGGAGVDEADDEDEAGDVVGVTLTWSAWGAPAGDGEGRPLTRNPGARKLRP